MDSSNSSFILYDLILNISFLVKCEGALEIINNLGNYIMLILLFVMLFRGWKWIQPVKKWIPDPLLIITIGVIIGFIKRFDLTENGIIPREEQDHLMDRRLFLIQQLKFFFVPMLILNGAYE